MNSIAGVIDSLPHPSNGIHISEFGLGYTGVRTQYELPVV